MSHFKESRDCRDLQRSRTNARIFCSVVFFALAGESPQALYSPGANASVSNLACGVFPNEAISTRRSQACIRVS